MCVVVCITMEVLKELRECDKIPPLFVLIFLTAHARLVKIS